MSIFAQDAQGLYPQWGLFFISHCPLFPSLPFSVVLPIMDNYSLICAPLYSFPNVLRVYFMLGMGYPWYSCAFIEFRPKYQCFCCHRCPCGTIWYQLCQSNSFQSRRKNLSLFDSNVRLLWLLPFPLFLKTLTSFLPPSSLSNVKHHCINSNLFLCPGDGCYSHYAGRASISFTPISTPTSSATTTTIPISVPNPGALKADDANAHSAVRL